MWYNDEVEKTDFIKTIPGAMNADPPMDFDPEFAGGWYSGCDNLVDLRNWFSPSDVAELSKAGYNLYKFEVKEYRFANGHAWFRREGAIFTPVPIDVLDIKQ